MKEFREWDRRYRERQAPVGRRHRLANLVKRPAAALAQARRDVEKIGAEVEAVSGVSRARQVRQLWELRMRYGLERDSYLDYQLYRPERWAQANLFVAERMHTRLSRLLHWAYATEGDGPRIADKRLFPGWCAEHGLPAAPVLAEWDDGVLSYDRITDRGLPAQDLFSKPADMNQGWQTQPWRYDGAGGYVGADGMRRRAEELLAFLAQASTQIPKRWIYSSTRLILMPRLVNHPWNARLSNGALCTMRVVTYRPPGGRATLLTATYKMASGDAPADNFHFGGMLAPVDLETGRLGMGLSRRGHVLVEVDRHPDTGAAVLGHQLPDWDAAISTALRAHDAARTAPLFGWDVALTADGPVLLEGNIDGAPDIAQAPTGRPMGATPYVAAVNAHLRLVDRRGRPIEAPGGNPFNAPGGT